MIIVEGPDGGGKTTLLNKLHTEFELPIAERVVSKEAEALVSLKHWVEHNVYLGFQTVLFDRHRLISEPIYGPILRDEPEEGFDDVHWLSDMMWKFYECKPAIIYCLPPLETVMDNVRDDADNRVVRSQIKSIYSAYCARAALDLSLSPSTILYNYEETSLDMVVRQVNFQLALKVGVG